MPVPTAQERVKQHLRQTKDLTLNSLTAKTKAYPPSNSKLGIVFNYVFNCIQCSVGKKGMQHIQLTVLHLLTLRNATRRRNIRSFW